MFKLYKKYKTKTNLINYTQTRNKVSYKIKLLKQHKENKIAKNIKTNPKAFYQYIASKTIKKEGVSDLTDSNGNLTSNDQEKCEILNSYFSSVFMLAWQFVMLYKRLEESGFFSLFIMAILCG